VLYALGDPVSLLLLLVSFVVAVTAHGWVQALIADRAGDRRPRQEGRLRPDPRRHIDPFGAVAALIAGIGWARPVEAPDRQRRAALLSVLLSGAAVNLLLAVVSLVGFRLLYGGVWSVSATLLQHGVRGESLGVRAALLFGLMNLYVGLLSLVPLPPLDGGRLLFALAPRSLGWQKAAYQLIDNNVGVVVLLLLLLLPLGGPQALLPVILDDLASPLARLVTGG
jgi:Zn-dependent protease